MVSGDPTARTRRPAIVRAPRTDTCWPMTARTAVSNGSTLPGNAQPGHQGDERSQRRVAGECCVDRLGIGVEVEQPAQTPHGGRQVAPVGEAELHTHVRSATLHDKRAVDRGDAVAVGKRQRADESVAVGRLDPGDRAVGEERHHLLEVERLADSEVDDDGPRCRCGGAPRLTSRGIVSQLRRRCREHSLHGVVELADAAEPGSEGDRRERHRRRLDEYPSGRRPLCSGDGQRPGAELIGDHPIEVTLAVVQSSGESGDAVPIDHAVADQAHRPGDDVATDVPFRRARRGVGTTSFAGPVAMFVGRRGGREELDVGALRRDRRAARTAVDAGGPHGPDEVTVEARVATRDGPVALLVVQHHVTMMATADPDH